MLSPTCPFDVSFRNSVHHRFDSFLTSRGLNQKKDSNGPPLLLAPITPFHCFLLISQMKAMTFKQLSQEKSLLPKAEIVHVTIITYLKHVKKSLNIFINSN